VKGEDPPAVAHPRASAPDPRPDGEAGPGPLLPLRTSEDTTGEVARLMAKFERRNNAPDIVREIANSERGFSLWVHGIDSLMYRADLPAVDREAAILRLAATVGSTYEWEQHRPIALEAGLSAGAIEAIGRLDPPEGLSASATLAIGVADTVLAGGSLSDETWSACRAQWGDAGAFDLLLTVAWWGGLVPLLIRMFRL
jgi:4-carboxymuconolactone decarboxylase